jgi:PAS domain S-box-containing protein
LDDEPATTTGGPFELPRLCRYFSERSSQPMLAVEGMTNIVRYLNDAFARLVGKKRTELVGLPFAKAVPEGDNNRCVALLSRVYRTGFPENLSEQQHRQTPPAFWSYAVWPILGADDRPVGVMIQVTDVTEMAIFRKQSTDMNQTLVLSSVRQHELTETAEKVNGSLKASEAEYRRQLEITQKQATALAEMDHRKDEFLAMLGHELRNPLAPILNAAILLRLQNDKDRARGIENSLLQKTASIIERQIGQLTSIIDELLEVSRITTGKIHLHKQRIAFGVVVQHAEATIRSLIDERQHVLAVSVPTEAIWLQADAVRMEQVMVNLLTNAAKYTDPKGHIWVTLQQEGTEAVLRIRDTGVGIAPEFLPGIFDLFTQAERTLDRSQGGLGIGLALVKRLVEMHGGTVKATSTAGHGSEFVVRLPVAPSPDGLPMSPPTRKIESNGPSLRVLVVDDNVDIVTTLAMLVRESGHDVRTAYDGPAVLKLALDYRPNVILLDIGLPGLNGYEVAKQIRQQPEMQNTLLVAMSGYGLPSDLLHSREAGFDHHIVKPADFAKVLKILTTASESRVQ